MENYVSHYEDGSNQWRLYHIDGLGLYFYYTGSDGTIDLAGPEITDTDWHHVALVRNGNRFDIYLDGVS